MSHRHAGGLTTESLVAGFALDQIIYLAFIAFMHAKLAVTYGTFMLDRSLSLSRRSLTENFQVGEKVVIRIEKEFMPGEIFRIRPELGYEVRIAATYELDGTPRHRPLLVVPFEAKYELFRGELR